MSEFKVSVEKVKLLPHSNAEKLDVAKIGNYSLVIQKGNYNDGDRVVFAPKQAVLPDEIKGDYCNSDTGISYLSGPDSNRVKAVKLRGEPSEGVTLNPQWVIQKLGVTSLDEIPLGENLSEKLGITKWEIPLPSNFAGQLQRIETVADFKRHDVESFRLYQNEFTPGEPVIATEKLHGCFQAKTSIYFSDGTRETIDNIVKNKITKEVWSVNSDNQLVATPIINWFINGKSNEWLHIKYERNGFDRGVSHQTIKVTPNHHIFDPILNTYKPAYLFEVGDYILASRNNLHFSYFHEQILIGKMLGDASYQWQSNRITFSHKKEHESYLDFTLKALNGILNKGKEQLSGYGTTMVRAATLSNPVYKTLFHEWIVNGKKQVPENINLSPISLAFWYMDDGSLNTHEDQEDRASFATCGFDEQSIDNLIISLGKLSLQATKHFYDNYWRINLNSDNADKLFTLIRPYVPKCMQYKLPIYYRGSEIDLEIENKSRYKQSIKLAKIVYIAKLSENKSKYDIETENHNYFAGGMLVHNSQINILRDANGKRFVTSKGMAGKHASIVEDDKNIYWKAVRNTGLFDLLDKHLAHHNVQLFGEVIPCQGGNYLYGQDPNRPIVKLFRVLIEGNDLKYGFKLYESLNFVWENWVPVLYEGPFDADKLVELSKGMEQVSGKQLHIREGVVVAPETPRLSSEGFPLLLKIINPRYKETGEEFA